MGCVNYFHMSYVCTWWQQSVESHKHQNSKHMFEQQTYITEPNVQIDVFLYEL